MTVGIKTHTGKVASKLEDNTLVTGGLDGSFMTFTTMDYSNLVEGVQGKDLAYDSVLKALLRYKGDLEQGRTVTVYIEWDITGDYREYLSCNVLRVEVE